MVGTARTQFLRAPCIYRGPNRIRFKGPPHVYEAAIFYVSRLAISCDLVVGAGHTGSLKKTDIELPVNLIIIGVILPGKADRRT